MPTTFFSISSFPVEKDTLLHGRFFGLAKPAFSYPHPQRFSKQLYPVCRLRTQSDQRKDYLRPVLQEKL